jgi:hypothetical protein
VPAPPPSLRTYNQRTTADEVAAEEQFLESTPWANPRHPSHLEARSQHESRFAPGQSRVPSYQTPAGQRRIVESSIGHCIRQWSDRRLRVTCTTDETSHSRLRSLLGDTRAAPSSNGAIQRLVRRHVESRTTEHGHPASRCEWTALGPRRAFPRSNDAAPRCVRPMMLR